MYPLSTLRRQNRFAFAYIVLLVLTPCVAHCVTGTPFQVFDKGKNIIVWQRFGQWLMITEDIPEGRVCYYYDPTMHSKLNLKSALPGTWQPLGSAIKWLMYVDHIQDLDRLITHDVDSQAWHITKPSTLRQLGCGMVGNICYFGECCKEPIGDVTPVDIYTADVGSGVIVPFCSSSSEKSEFAHDGNLLVYKSRYPSGRIGIYGHYFNGSGEFMIHECEAYQPSVCESLVAWAERSGSGWNIFAKNMTSGETRNLAYTTTDPPNPEAGMNSVFWMDSRNSASTGIDIYGYDWETRQEFVVTEATGDQTGLRACNDLVTWVSGDTNNQTLWAAKIQPPTIIADFRPTAIGGSLVTLAWTAIGTASDPAISYDVRESPFGPISSSNWEQAESICVYSSSTEAGQSICIDIEGLQQGYHYLAVRAAYADDSQTDISNCIRIYISAHVRDALQADYGTFIGLEGVVAGVSPDMAFYVIQNVGILGVRIVPSTQQVTPAIGDIVQVTGLLTQSDEYYGPFVCQSYVTPQNATHDICSYATANKHLGGSAADLAGASNVWLPVKTWGRVSSLTLGNGCVFTISDGSCNEGVHVTSPFDPPDELADGDFVSVAGICKVSRTAGRTLEIVQEDQIQELD